MVNHCVVPGCQSNRGRFVRRITVFRIPQDPELREQWRNIIGIKEFRACHRVCCKHFHEQDIIRYREYFDTAGNCIYRVSLPYPRLKKSAIPVITQDEGQETEAPEVVKKAKNQNHQNHENAISGSVHNTNSNLKVQNAVQKNCIINANVTSQKSVALSGGNVDGFKVIPISTQSIRIVDESKIIPIPTQLILVRQVIPTNANSFPESKGTEVHIPQTNETNKPVVVPSFSQSSNNDDHDHDSRQPEESEFHVHDSNNTSTLEFSPSQEPEETHLEFVREFTPIDLFSQLHLCLDKLKLPQNWYMKSSLEEGYVSLFEVHVKANCPDINNTSPLVFKKSVFVDNSMKVSYFVIGLKVPNFETFDLLQTLDNVDELQHILESFNGLTLCSGISDSENVASLQNEDRQIDQLGFLRHKSCELLSTLKRCTQCAKGLKAITQKNRRIRQRESQGNETNDSNYSSPFTIEDWKRKNACLRVALARKNETIENLKKSISQLTDEIE